MRTEGCNGSPTVEPETRDFRPVPDRSATSIIRPSRLASCLFFFNPHLVVLCPSFSSPFLPIFDGHHSNFGINSLLVHSMPHTSMPCGSSFPFHPTTTTLFRYSSTSLVTTPSADSTLCPRSTSRRIGFSRALCLGHRRAPFSSLFSYLF